MSGRALRAMCAVVITVATVGCAVDPSATEPDDLIVLVDVPGGVAAASTSHGPFREEMGLAFGFSHDPIGAAIAATHLSPRLSTAAGPDVATATLIQQCWGDVAAARARLLAAPPLSDQPPTGDQVPDALFFRVIAGDPTGEHVVVSLLADTARARARRGFARVDATLRWSDGDWRLRVPTQSAALHPDLDGYTMLGSRS
ncbi:hypothetical protein [Pseudonocardia sp. GCM10023141]|uniref:hypothetical protein n=1 Tax=Pseudonocardia sp. GCM10023141 TaxID=3252653 RepID=UPI0036077458